MIFTFGSELPHAFVSCHVVFLLGLVGFLVLYFKIGNLPGFHTGTIWAVRTSAGQCVCVCVCVFGCVCMCGMLHIGCEC